MLKFNPIVGKNLEKFVESLVCVYKFMGFVNNLNSISFIIVLSN